MEKLDKNFWKQEIKIDKKFIKKFIGIFAILVIFVNIDLIWQTINYGIIQLPGIIFDILLDLIVYSLLVSIFKYSKVAFRIMYVVSLVVLVISQVKYQMMNEPLYFSDLKFLVQSFNILKLVNFGSLPVEKVIAVLIYMFVYVLINELIVYYSSIKTEKIENKNYRISMFFISIILLLVIFVPNKVTKNFALKYIFQNDTYNDADSYTTNYSFYRRYGMIPGMYGVYLNSYFTEPKGYNEQEIIDTINNYQDTEEKTINLGKPNIIVVFSESFFDIDKIDEVKFDKAVVPNFEKIRNNDKDLNLISPTFGGMSENVTFEFLTGGKHCYFPKGYIPIMSLYNRKNSNEYYSYVKELKNNGYKTSIKFSKDYYSSEKAYKKMGFDNYKEISTEAQTLNDEGLIKIIENDIDENKENYFGIYSTVEAHMPYSIEKYKDYDINVENSTLDEFATDSLLSYSQSIYNADKSLGDLYNYVKNIKEPTIVIYVADHLPYIFDENYNSILLSLNYFNTDDELLNLYRKYNTEGVMFANFDISSIQTKNISGYDSVFYSILKNMDINLSKEYKYLDTFNTNLVAYNRDIAIDSNGKMYYTNNLPDNLKEIYNKRNYLQYYLLMK